jgi:hypothetical protein
MLLKARQAQQCLSALCWQTLMRNSNWLKSVAEPEPPAQEGKKAPMQRIQQCKLGFGVT